MIKGSALTLTEVTEVINGAQDVRLLLKCRSTSGRVALALEIIEIQYFFSEHSCSLIHLPKFLAIKRGFFLSTAIDRMNSELSGVRVAQCLQ